MDTTMIDLPPRREVPDPARPGWIKVQGQAPCGCWLDLPWRYKRDGEMQDYRAAVRAHRCTKAVPPW